MAELSRVWSFVNPELSCEHKRWLNRAQHREGRTLALGCAALLAARAWSDQQIDETVVNKTCKPQGISHAKFSVCGACAP